MKIRNKEAFSDEVNNFLDIYYSYIIKQNKEYYEGLPCAISKLEKEIPWLETKINIAQRAARWFEKKEEENSVFDFFIGSYEPELREYIDEKKNELTRKKIEYHENKKYYKLYTNLLNNGILINYSDDCCYEVGPYNNKLYSVIK